jgi:acyl transferase domain-containing protein
MAEHSERDGHGDEIAVIGMAGRFSRAADVEAYWRNIRDGVECITFFTDDELRAVGVTEEQIADPAYVKAKGVLEQTEYFDAPFFGYSPREAEIMDPQTRHFLEVAWTALEHAGYDSETAEGPIGVYAGASSSSYMLYNTMVNPHGLYALGGLQASLLTGSGFVSTWTSYKLNLRGPSLSVSTACSTALVAIHVASQSLLNGECGMALAGGVGINTPVYTGYMYDEGGISSNDGHTRSFDADAKGTVSGSGLGVVVLKRLDDALADGDTVYAVIKGSAINNDGSMKIGYTAPSVDGQAEVIAEAQAIAGVKPESIGFVECHGSATPLGDPIEVTALTQAFRGSGAKPNSVAIGSVKSNLGHLDSAAGIAGFIKAVQSLRHKQIPPSLHFKRPNPQADFAAGPFYVPTEVRDWPRNGTPRRAGVSSFGIGGTNCHVVLEESPERTETEDRPWQLVVLSAKTPSALDAATKNLVGYLRENPDANLADTAFTLQAGRRMFAHRRAAVVRDVADAATALAAMNPGRVSTGSGEPEEHPVVFMFPGEGAQHAGMGADLYEGEEAFRDAIDDCAAAFQRPLGLDIRTLLYPTTEDAAGEAHARLMGPAMGQPGIFATSYALARLWMAWGVEPESMVGHGVGEYVAATLSGVLSLDDSAALVAERGRLMEEMAEGGLLVVGRPEAEVRQHLAGDTVVFSLEGPSLTVLTGPGEDVQETEQRLAAAGIAAQRQPVRHAPTASGLEAAAKTFAERAAKVRTGEASIPFVSGVTGKWITESDAADASHWVRHLSGPVRFADAARELVSDSARILLEVGPGGLLSGSARAHPDRAPAQAVIPSMMRTFGDSDRAAVLKAVGALWIAGRRIDWRALAGTDERRRVPLPTYPFERRRYWLDAPGAPPREVVEEVAEASLPKEPGARTTHPRPNLQVEYVEPREDSERAIVAIWEELFGISPIGVYDNFFELGGHSLLGTQVVSRVRSVLEVELPVRVLFEGPTVAEMAEAVARGEGAGAGPVEAIQRADRGEDANDLLARIDDLSEEEMEALLAQLSAGEEEV